MREAILALEDGCVMRGRSFGAEGTALGEVCFNTSMTGYQEVLTDPSYRGQIVAMTYPQIGNYGTNPQDNESRGVHVRAFVVRELSPVVSNWRARQGLDEYLRDARVPGIERIDTRALTKRLRVCGSMRGVVTTEKLSDAAAVDLARSAQYLGIDFVKEVTTPEAYDWDAADTASRDWRPVCGKEVPGEDGFAPSSVLPPARHRIVAYDFGVKFNILRRLRQHGFRVRVVPAHTPAEEVLATDPEGIFLSNGPGDPAELTYAHENVRQLIGKRPIFGICLGHQILGYALGGKTFKLKFGHRGGNQPVKDLTTGKIAITSQNHGFAVDAASVPDGEAEITHINLNDHTCEGIRHRSAGVFSVQYHPEAAPGPHDAGYFFAAFAKKVELWKQSR